MSLEYKPETEIFISNLDTARAYGLNGRQIRRLNKKAEKKVGISCIPRSHTNTRATIQQFYNLSQ